MKTTYSIEPLNPADLTSALRTVREVTSMDRAFVPAPGVGVDALLDWALADIRDATYARTRKDRKGVERAATNAVGNARRALACLFDWYLNRDGFSFCGDAPKGAEEKSVILKSRGLIDELTSRALSRAIDVRNAVEHEYRSITLEEAEDVVELLRRTIQVLRGTSDPGEARCILGGMQYSIQNGPEGREVLFHGWVPGNASIVIALFAAEPWVGIVIPQDRQVAVVRRISFRQLDTRTWSEVLRHLDSMTATLGSTTHDKYTLCRLLELAGLSEEPEPPRSGEN